MSVISHNRLIEMVESGVVQNSDLSYVQGASIDIHLSNSIFRENEDNTGLQVVSISDKRYPKMIERPLNAWDETLIMPGEFFLGSSIEYFDLPKNICARYSITSTMGRCGLEHLNAGWIDPGFQGSLTLEFINLLRFSCIDIRVGMRCGQIVFFDVEEVPDHADYKKVGRYNNSGKLMTAS